MKFRGTRSSIEKSVGVTRLTRAIVIRAELESRIALALVRAQGVDAGAVVAYVWIALALVDVDAIVSVAGQREAGVTDALKAALQIVARAVGADARPLVTLVDVDAVVLAEPELVAGRAHALEVALLIDALRVAAAGIRYLRTAGVNIERRHGHCITILS